MDPWRPLLGISPGTHGKVLEVLAGDTEPMTGNEVARRAGVDSGAAHRTLRDLAAHGVVWDGRLTQAHLYILDPEHLATPLLRQLASLTDQLAGRIDEFVSSWRPRPAWVGITAVPSEGGATCRHLLVVRKHGVDDDDRWREQLTELRERVVRLTGPTVEVSQAGMPIDVDALDDAWRAAAVTAHGHPPAGLAPATTTPADRSLTPAPPTPLAPAHRPDR